MSGNYCPYLDERLVIHHFGWVNTLGPECIIHPLGALSAAHLFFLFYLFTLHRICTIEFRARFYSMSSFST